jgi:hypothetical protein
MGGQQALGQQLTGGIQDITGAVGGVSQNIDALERAAEQYQREAQRQRAQIQTSGYTRPRATFSASIWCRPASQYRRRTAT